ncbi:MAG TPA: OB-fold domain-containing protein [Acidimicrobiia bacterium]|nr:OB-fold domain-containing protein [Acidimicrobiia bacterium]
MTTSEPQAQPARFEPVQTDVSAPFWDATREQRLLLQWCTDCEQPIFYPRAACPACFGSRLEWRPASGNGEVYAVTVDHRPQITTRRTEEQFAVALIDLDEGVRMMSNVIGCPPEDVTVGMRVVVAWEPLSDGRHLPQFTPA